VLDRDDGVAEVDEAVEDGDQRSMSAKWRPVVGSSST
jgi:hypothetical protein